MTDLFEIESYASFCYASIIFSSSSSLTSEDLKTCLTRPYWQLWSPPRPKQRRGVLCYRTVLTARSETMQKEKIGGMIENIIKISGHFNKKKSQKAKDKTKGEGTVPWHRNVFWSHVHWLCLQNKSWNRLSKVSKYQMCSECSLSTTCVLLWNI